MADSYISIPKFLGATVPEGEQLLGVQDGDRVRALRHGTISNGQVFSVHIQDNATSYQNTSGFDAFAILVVEASGVAQTRIINIYDSPTDNSTAGATLRFDINQNFFDSTNEKLTTPPMKISNNNFCVVENVTGAAGDIIIEVQSIVVERQV